jgi:hypothetical protein
VFWLPYPLQSIRELIHALSHGKLGCFRCLFRGFLKGRGAKRFVAWLVQRKKHVRACSNLRVVFSGLL